MHRPSKIHDDGFNARGAAYRERYLTRHQIEKHLGHRIPDRDVDPSFPHPPEDSVDAHVGVYDKWAVDAWAMKRHGAPPALSAPERTRRWAR
jgi:hypothetical protein